MNELFKKLNVGWRQLFIAAQHQNAFMKEGFSLHNLFIFYHNWGLLREADFYENTCMLIDFELLLNMESIH